MIEAKFTPWVHTETNRIADSQNRTVADCRFSADQGAAIVAAVNSYSDMRAALKSVLTLIDEGKLVRDISGDSEPDWALRQLPLVRTLQACRAALAKATGN